MSKKPNTENTESAEALSDTYNITVEGKEREIKMTYGLLQKLCGKFTTVGQIQNLDMDFDLQNYMINELLDERDGNGVRLNPGKDYSFALSIEEGEKLTAWVSEHVANFFILRLENQTKSQKQLEKLIGDLVKKAQALENESNPA
jgi:hypothetical protein